MQLTITDRLSLVQLSMQAGLWRRRSRMKADHSNQPTKGAVGLTMNSRAQPPPTKAHGKDTKSTSYQHHHPTFNMRN